MLNTILIIDDDVNVRKMLSHLIQKNNLGKVVAELCSGQHAVEEILFYNPDIVLVDLLLPSKDGIEIIRSSKEQGYNGKFIMISQVEDERMVSKAYEHGVVFFIDKPINAIEVINIIKMVSHSIELERSVDLIKTALSGIPNANETMQEKSIKDQIIDIFTEIGIVGELGSKDLIKVIHKIIQYKKENKNDPYQLQDIYRQVALEESQAENSKANARTIEQRIRRTILKALENIAALGHDDFYNSKFIDYGTRLFDLKQVKQEILCIDDPNEERGKINVRKFIEGVLSKLNC